MVLTHRVDNDVFDQHKFMVGFIKDGAVHKLVQAVGVATGQKLQRLGPALRRFQKAYQAAAGIMLWRAGGKLVRSKL